MELSLWEKVQVHEDHVKRINWALWLKNIKRPNALFVTHTIIPTEWRTRFLIYFGIFKHEYQILWKKIDSDPYENIPDLSQIQNLVKWLEFAKIYFHLNFFYLFFSRKYLYLIEDLKKQTTIKKKIKFDWIIGFLSFLQKKSITRKLE